jgi:4'-phosphopantetheinyl transferase
MSGHPAPEFQVALSTPSLEPGNVHLWRVNIAFARPEHREVLSPEEWIRAEQFHFPNDCERFVAGRAHLRQILAGYLDLLPQELCFRTNAHGKPELDRSDSLLRFNLSHSGDLLLLAVTHGREIGVDLELIRPGVPFEMLAAQYFEPDEAWTLRTLPEPERMQRFYDVWTRTEAQLKAAGLGIGSWKTVEPNRWSLLSFTPAEGYTAALAVEAGEFALTCWTWPK